MWHDPGLAGCRARSRRQRARCDTWTDLAAGADVKVRSVGRIVRLTQLSGCQ